MQTARLSLVLTAACAALLIVLAPAAAQTASGDVRVFALNLSPAATDVYLGGTAPAFQALNLAPGSAGAIGPAIKPGAYRITFRLAGSRTLQTPRNPGGQPYDWNLVGGKVYALRILGDNQADLVELPAPAQPAADRGDAWPARISFANAGTAALTKLRLASAPESNVLVELAQLAPRELSTFAALPVPAALGAFWTWQSAGKDMVGTIGEAVDKPTLTQYRDGSWWILVVGAETRNGRPVGKLFDITPAN